MGVVLKKYKVKVAGKVHEFSELCDAWNFADQHGVKRPGRFWEKDSQPYLRGLTKGGEKVNARPE